MNILKNQTYLIIISLIILWNIILRIYFWPDQPINNFFYYNSLENHLLEYIINTGMKPPMMYFFNGMLLKIFGAEFVRSHYLMLVSVIILDMISFILIFYVLILTKISYLKTSLIVLMYSFYQIPIEFWKLGTHYDSFNLFFNTLFISLVIIFLKRPKIKFGILMSICGSLLILYGSAFFIVVPITIAFVIFLLSVSNYNTNKILKLSLVCLFLPIMTGMGICSKNYITRDVFAPSTFGGVGLMLTTMRTVDRSIIEGDKIVKNSRAPHWFKWCWEKAGNFLPKEYEKDYVAVVNNKVFGQCAEIIPLAGMERAKSIQDAHNLNVNNKNSYPFDMTKLKKYLISTKATIPLNAVKKDIYIMENKKYLIHGTSPELALYWTDLYGKVGKKIFLEDFYNNPKRYLKTFVKLFKEFTVDGSQFPLVLSIFNERSGFFNKQFSNKYFTSTLRLLGNILQLILLITLTTYIYLYYKLFMSLLNKSKKLNYDQINIISIGFPAILLTILYSTIIGEENSRYFIYAIPYYVISFSYIKFPKNLQKLFKSS